MGQGKTPILRLTRIVSDNGPRMEDREEIPDDAVCNATIARMRDGGGLP